MSKHGLSKIEVSEKLEHFYSEYNSAGSILHHSDLRTEKRFSIFTFCAFLLIFSSIIILTGGKIKYHWLCLEFLLIVLIGGFAFLRPYFSRKKKYLNAEKTIADPEAKACAQLVSLVNGYNDIVVRLAENEDFVNSFDESLLQAMQRVYEGLTKIKDELCNKLVYYEKIEQLHESMKDDLIFLKSFPRLLPRV